jgi:regulator of replication initiation timing
MTRGEYLELMGTMAALTDRITRLQRDVSAIRDALGEPIDIDDRLHELERRLSRRLDEKSADILDIMGATLYLAQSSR